jgi:hypothetical protein
MSECENVKIFYKNIDPDTGEKHEDALQITDLVIGEGEDCDYVFFSYKITPGATKYAGLLIFAITFRMGEDSVWSTEPYDGIPVGFRFETSESIKENVAPDLLEAWKAEIVESITKAVNVDIVAEVEKALNQAKESGEFKGEKGDKGEDGKDGYTPIKGVDYFDGLDGKDGTNGKDGADGKDYVLTEADKEEIAKIAAEKIDIPSGGIDFTTDETLNLNPATKVLSVNTATEASAGSMLPITSGAVYTLVGDIETLLSRI